MNAANDATEPTEKAHLPAVDQVLHWPTMVALAAAHGRAVVTAAIRAELAARRHAHQTTSEAALAAAITERSLAQLAPSLRPVFNLTGTVLHTNLGRAPLAPEAIEAMLAVASGASNLEYNLTTGKRGERDDHVEDCLCRLTGAEAATVVNNNAAAVLLVLNTLALRKEVLVSRGELVEIGGAFRLPEIMLRAGCKLREVGTTNRTHLRDYSEAIGSRTGLLFKAHTSNYSIQGFTATVDETQLAEAARSHGLPFAVDLGSGTLINLARYGLRHEPTPAETLAHGANLVTFSGDKLLGGPQAGIIVGAADLIARLKKNPLKRALRCDKLSLAALEATLRLYADPDRLAQRVPTLRLLVRQPAEIEAAARRLQPVISRWIKDASSVDVSPVQSQVGSGSMPLDLLPSFALRIRPPAVKRSSGRALKDLAARFRSLAVPVIGRIAEEAFLLDVRCLEPAQEAEFTVLFHSETAP